MTTPISTALCVLFLNLISLTTWAAKVAKVVPPVVHTIPPNRVASFFISQDFINEQLAKHVKTPLMQDLKITLDADQDQIFLRGVASVPIEELRAVNLDPKLGKFKFQFAAKLSTTNKGHLIIELPLNETFFYPFDSTNPRHDRVIVPVQLLSIALASARGYLAALSGDFGSFDRRTEKLEALIKALDHAIAHEKNADALDDLRTQRDALKNQVEAIPIERKQLKTAAKELNAMMSFTGEKEISLNDEFAARKNALILKIELAKLMPFLKGVELGGVRLRHDQKDGNGENYLAIDVNSQLENPNAVAITTTPTDRPPMQVAPLLIMRLNETLFESEALVNAEKAQMGDKLRDFRVHLEDDGLHVSGKYHTLMVLSLPFETVVDFASTGLDVFEARVRDIKIADIDVEFLSKFILEALKKRLDQSLKGICKFKFIDDDRDDSHSLEVTIDPKQMMPAFPDLHLVDVDVRKSEFLMKIGRQYN